MVAHDTHQPVKQSVHEASQALPTLQCKMGFNASTHHDPVQKAEKSMTAFNTSIGKDGESLYTFEDFSIVCKFQNMKSEDEKERDKNEAYGFGDLTNAERILLECSYYAEYNDDDWLTSDDDYSIYSYADSYVDMVNKGQIEDADWSCRMVPQSIGDSVDGGAFADAQESEADYGAEFDLTFEDFYPTQEDGSLETATAESGEAPLITSKLDLGGLFTKAASPEQQPPETVAPTPVPVAANNQSFQMSA